MNEGNRDGSKKAAFPKQVSQAVSLLITSWLSSDAFEVTYEKSVDKVLFFEQIGALLGIPFMDEEMKELYLVFGSCELER